MPATKLLQDTFLKKLFDNKELVSIFLVNGIKLQGYIGERDPDVIFLYNNENVQMIYKHAVSTIVPLRPINLE